VSLAEWRSNLSRLLGGRPAWSAEAEFDYYRVSPEVVAAHRQNQEAFAREAHFTGLRIAKGHAMLDTRLVAGASVLDLGAGECCLSEALAFSLGASAVWAVDAVPKQIWAAAERYRDEAKLKFLIADARNLPFEDSGFDLATANLLLHHLEPLEPVLSEVFRVLRPGGRFSASEPSPITGTLVHHRTSANEAPLPPQKIRATLERAGFERIQIDYYWNRLDSGLLGPLSPGYRVVAFKPGPSSSATPKLSRELTASRLPGLRVDPGSGLTALVEQQEDAIAALL
jgi:ubiquinone/menaquinone biosynthesis C-methylase UbiE